ncbi:Ribosomal protein L28e [Lasiodiplodia theobromae]|uniref:Putative 60S ribosomal protein L28e n=1 Tax=Lasiodiplodia theobromae TaxID=45133 RepID=A0A5N5DGX3_9PEZI|nr:Ribosomal protein L28e [Lasiodiplodia theobromae]KAB2576947.1 putative 60S ribosomal protein L28e [Lasiodiplodia theobromae]KAF4543593.1 Ribosomal protein L28e [Lasiodiplodia theobromae]KAF9631325.1 Ribosomal protein L28e [Lasiodiplodia theobromae]
MVQNVSADLVWEVTRNTSAFLLKRKQAGGVQFSRDPLNLTNKHARKYEGFVNDKAYGIQPTENGGVQLTIKKANKYNKPINAIQTSTFGPATSSRKVYKNIINSTVKRHYRADLQKEAVARASAIKKSQKPVKAAKPAKLRGKKALQQAAKSE